MKLRSFAIEKLISVWLTLLAMFGTDANAQERPVSIEIRPTFGIGLFGLPELSKAHPFPNGEYDGPDLALGGGISLAYWFSTKVNLSLGIEYHQLTTKYIVNPDENQLLSNVWRVTFVPIIFRCEYVLPIHMSLISPFVGVGAGYSFCTVEYEQNYAELAIRNDAFSFIGPVRNVFTLDVGAGVLFDISRKFGGSVTCEFWRTGNTHHMNVRTPSDKLEGLEMYVSGFAVSLSARF
jgi:hypothetical protein